MLSMLYLFWKLQNTKTVHDMKFQIINIIKLFYI